MPVKTYKYRIKDSISSKALLKMSSQVNKVWNYCAATSRLAYKRQRKVLYNFDLHKLTSGSSQLLGLHSQTIQAVCDQYAKSSKQHKKLAKFRSYKRQLGWIPFKSCAVKVNEGSVVFSKQTFKFWKSREMEGKIKTGCFTQNSRGRWFVCFACEVKQKQSQAADEVGIDLGLKENVTLSNGEQFSRENLTKKCEDKLAMAQRARKWRQVSKIHCKIKDARLDWNHKVTTHIANKFGKIVVGDVESQQIVDKNSRLAKSVYDAGWFQVKQLLKYKAGMLGVVYVEVNEAYTTKTCSHCGQRSGPSGLSQLGVREWHCQHCGVVHSRDVNAAKNILRRGHTSPMKQLGNENGKAAEGILGV